MQANIRDYTTIVSLSEASIIAWKHLISQLCESAFWTYVCRMWKWLLFSRPLVFNMSSKQASNQLATPGEAKSFLKGAQILDRTCIINLYHKNIFSRGTKIFPRGKFFPLRPPFITSLLLKLCNIANDAIIPFCLHIPIEKTLIK